ncbi:MAG: class I SAM-dependent methyltransferase [Thermodesulfobacteriota bacterium]
MPATPSPRFGSFICTRCRKEKLSFSGSALSCSGCGASFPVRHGIPDLAPEIVIARSPAQMLMEFPPVVRIYESRLWRRSPFFMLRTGISFDREAALITRAARLSDAGSLLDLACGPGIYTRPFARAMKAKPVVGVDLSMPMLRQALRYASRQNLDNLCFARASAFSLPFADRSFDVVNCCGALHLFGDTPRALTEISRVLSPGGRFTAAVFRRNGASRLGLSRWMGRASGVESYSPGGLAEMLSKAGIKGMEVLHAAGLWMIVGAEKEG